MLFPVMDLGYKKFSLWSRNDEKSSPLRFHDGCIAEAMESIMHKVIPTVLLTESVPSEILIRSLISIV